jgi:hypothetical protein
MRKRTGDLEWATNGPKTPSTGVKGRTTTSSWRSPSLRGRPSGIRAWVFRGSYRVSEMDGWGGI